MIIHTHDDDSSYHPAMPAVEIHVQRRTGQPSLSLKAIVDSGADATMIPKYHLNHLNVRKGQTKWLVGVGGGRYEVDIYTLAVKVGNQPIQYLDVVGTEQRDEVIVGRDLLNQYVITLNAPGHTVDVTL